MKYEEVCVYYARVKINDNLTINLLIIFILTNSLVSLKTA